jgi:hypothetical protein
VNCSNCGRELGPSDAFCPSCGQAQRTATTDPSGSPAGPSPAPPSGQAGPSSVPAYRFDRSRLTPFDWVAGIASVVLFISLFLPWYGVSVGPISVTFSGLTAHGYLYIPLILSLVEVLYLIAVAGWKEVRERIPVPHEVTLTVVNVISLIFVVIAFFDKGPSGIGWRVGAFIGLIAAIVAAVPNLVLSLASRTRAR